MASNGNAVEATIPAPNPGVHQTATERALGNYDILTMVISRLEYPSDSWTYNECKEGWPLITLPRLVSKLWKSEWDKALAQALHTQNETLTSQPLAYLSILASVSRLPWQRISLSRYSRYTGTACKALAGIVRICASHLRHLELPGLALVSIAQHVADGADIEFPQLRYLKLDLESMEDKHPSKLVRAAISVLRHMPVLASCAIEVRPHEMRGQGQVPWQQREIVLAVRSRRVTDLHLKISGWYGDLRSMELGPLLEHFPKVQSLHLESLFSRADLTKEMWPANLERLTIEGAPQNSPQLLQISSNPAIMPNLTHLPVITYDSTILDEYENEFPAEWTVTRWMVDQAVTGLRRRGGIPDFESVKLDLYDLVNEHLPDFEHVGPGWGSVRKPGAQ